MANEKEKKLKDIVVNDLEEKNKVKEKKKANIIKDKDLKQYKDYEIFHTRFKIDDTEPDTEKGGNRFILKKFEAEKKILIHFYG